MTSFNGAKSFCVAAGLACLTFTSSAAYADDIVYPTTTLRAAGTPVSITDCKVTTDFYGHASLNVYNRSDHFLASVTIRWTLYNHSGEMMGQGDQVYTLQDHAAPSDSALLNEGLNVKMSEPWTSVDRATCRLQAATFEGNRTWDYGRSWSGRLSPLPQADSFHDDGSSGVSELGASTNLPRTKAQIALTVENAWNDTVSGNMYIHVALNIQGGQGDSTLRPRMLRLAMSLANGTKKSYAAMESPAPRYQKINPLLSNTVTLAYEVDPKDDLGSLGSVTVPAHSTAHIVATFLVGDDVVANPNDNRQVSLR